jgi:hypothetical protein
MPKLKELTQNKYLKRPYNKIEFPLSYGNRILSFHCIIIRKIQQIQYLNELFKLLDNQCEQLTFGWCGLTSKQVYLEWQSAICFVTWQLKHHFLVMNLFWISKKQFLIMLFEIRYLEVIANFYDNIVGDLKKPEEITRQSISEANMTDFTVLGKLFYLLLTLFHIRVGLFIYFQHKTSILLN